MRPALASDSLAFPRDFLLRPRCILSYVSHLLLSLSDAHVLLFEERDRALHLAAENDELRGKYARSSIGRCTVAQLCVLSDAQRKTNRRDGAFNTCWH